MASQRPSSLKANDATPGTRAVSPSARSRTPRLFSGRFLCFSSLSRASSDRPMEYASQRPSSEKRGSAPYPITTTESVPTRRIRSSSSSFTRPIGTASHSPVGARRPVPSVSHRP